MSRRADAEAGGSDRRRRSDISLALALPVVAIPACEGRAMTRKIYVATSWRNSLQPSIVVALRADGHAVFDFREANGSFRWPPIATAQDYMDCLATHGPAIAALE